MAIEIERKFLVKKELVPEADKCIRMHQAYLCIEPERTMRVRIADDRAFLTIKGAMSGISRMEFEYEIPEKDARELLKLAISSPVEKVRKIIFEEGKKWEVDFFEGENIGLVLAEIELKTAEETVILPDWIAEEVSGDIRYHNSQLSQHPFSKWG